MEALRHFSEREAYHQASRNPPPERTSVPVTILKAHIPDETGILQIETTRCWGSALLDTLAEDDALPRGPALELISLRRERGNSQRIGLDRGTLLEVYRYLDLDPWLLGPLYRTSAGWTCCGFARGILNFQLVTSMYYLAWSVNTTGPRTKTKAILMAQEHVGYSRCFSSENMFDHVVRESIINLQQPFSLANAVLLDVVSYMQCMLDEQWETEVATENLTGHGVFGYRYHERLHGSLETENLASAARETGLSVGMIGWCFRLGEIAEKMASDLEDEVDRFRASTRGRPTASVEAGHLGTDLASQGSYMRALDSVKKIIWNSKMEARDLENRVKAQSETVSNYPTLDIPWDFSIFINANSLEREVRSYFANRSLL